MNQLINHKLPPHSTFSPTSTLEDTLLRRISPPLFFLCRLYTLPGKEFSAVSGFHSYYTTTTPARVENPLAARAREATICPRLHIGTRDPTRRIMYRGEHYELLPARVVARLMSRAIDVSIAECIIIREGIMWQCICRKARGEK